MTINERVFSLIRENKGFTQKELANSLGVASSTVNNWLKLGRSIPAELIIPICEYFGISCNYLLTGTDSNTLPSDDTEWLSLIHKLPIEARYEFRGEIKGYLKRLGEESSSGDEPLKQAK